MCTSCGKVKMKSAPKIGGSRKMFSSKPSAQNRPNPYLSFGKPKISFSRKSK